MSKSFTPMEQREHDKRALVGGLKGAAIVGVIGAAALAVGQRYSPAARQLTTPMKAFLLASATGAGAISGSDVASRAFQKEVFEQEKPLAAPDHTSSTHHALEWAVDNRWSIIGASWATAMGGSLMYSFSKKTLTTTQKFYHARVYAQAVTLAVLMASAGLSMYVGEDSHKKQKGQHDDALKAVLELPSSQRQAGL